MRTLLLGLALSVVPCVSFAQDKVSYREIEFYSQTADGNPSVCGTEFTYLFQDNSYKKGAAAGLHGSVAWNVTAQGGFLALLKMTGMDFPNGLTKGGPVIFPINTAAIRVGDKVLRPTQYTCEKNDGSFCGGFGAMDASYINIAMEGSPKATLIFNRVKGGLDYGFELVRKPDPAQDINKYMTQSVENAQCMLDILKRVKTN